MGSAFFATITQRLWIQVVSFKNVIFHKESAAWLCALPLRIFEVLQFLFEKSPAIFWKRPSTHTRLHRKPGAFYWQIPTPFQNSVLCILYAVICSSDHGILWRELVLTIWNMSLQENASSLWKRCNIRSNIKPSFQISRWASFVYITYSGPSIKGPFTKRVWYFLKHV